MTKARSPQYPAIGLKEAIELARMVYDKDYQNPIPREIAAKHMGYSGLNGKSLGVLSALKKFGLIEGRGDDSRISDLAVRILAHPVGSKDHHEAVLEAAQKPDLFAEIDARFQAGRASDQAIRAYLLTQRFIPSAADAAIRAYRETKQFADVEAASREEGVPSQHDDISVSNFPKGNSSGEKRGERFEKLDLERGSTASFRPGMKQDVFTLKEGDVVLQWPERLSPDSYQDLEDWAGLILRKIKRSISADAASAQDVPKE